MTKKFRANDIWKRDGGRIVVTGNPGVGRYIFGVPVLLFGLHFYYTYLVLGIAEYIKASDIAGIFTGVLGWLVIVLVGWFFAVPGWLLVFLRRRVVLDVGRGMVDEMNDYLQMLKTERRDARQGQPIGVRVGIGIEKNRGSAGIRI